MKRIVSVSLGSSTRNHRVEVEFLGEKVTIERIGTDGNLSKAIEMIENLDGKVDAFGMGGIDLYLIAGKKRYVIKDATKMARAARKSPIVDGSGLKNTLERKVVHFLSDNLNINLKSKKILMASAVDRFGMAEAFSSVGADIIFGDFIFALGIPMPIKTLRGLEIIAGSLLPVLTRMPFHLLYPTGSKQEHDTPKYTRYYEKAEIIAGDFLFLKKYMPPKITGKIIVTNTVTSADIEELKKREAALLVTSTPEFSGRSFGTNVMEALIVSFSGKRPEDLSEDDYLQLLEKMKFEPRVVKLS
ncbi:MAG: quinate 5-dehydrogenase [Firmicutes bacterium]|nr:quinate 5-dehydrogenase [Bacillota bacterium]